MKKSAAKTLIVLIILFWTGLAGGVRRLPPPQFETDYQIPTATEPPPRMSVWDPADVAVLFGALLLSSWLTLKKRSRRWIVGLMIFSLAYFGFWRKGCICPIGAVGNVSLSLFDPSYALPAAATAFFLLPLLAGLFFGRAFCGAVCPLGAIQDLVVLHPLMVPGWMETALRLGAWLYLALSVLYAATGSGLLICRYDPFIAFFRLSPNSLLWLLGLLFLAVGVFIGRPYCRFVCPYGLLLRQAGRLSRRHVTITPDECIHCRLCEDVCPFGAIDKPTAHWPAEIFARDRRRMIFLFVLLPVLVAVGGWIGYRVHPALAQGNPTVALARQVQEMESGRMTELTDPIKAFHTTGTSVGALYAQRDQVLQKFAVGGTLVGAFVALIAAGKLIAVSIHRVRTDYQANRAGCLSCGRCFAYCPRQRIADKPESAGNRGSEKESAV
jgi:polyferredoxin